MNQSCVNLSDVVAVNPRIPKEIDEAQEVSFVAMGSAAEDGILLHEEPRVLAETKKGFTYFEKGDVLLAKITPCFENGKCLRPNQISRQVGFGSTEFHVLRANPKKIDNKYLFYFIWNEKFRSKGMAAMTGAAGQKRVSADFVKKFEIPLPSIIEQRRIAAIFDKADAIRRKRQQAIQLADQFLRAVFLDMFGDPVTNRNGWTIKKFGEVGNLDRGRSRHRPRNDPKLLGGEHALIQTGDVANSGGYIREYTSTYSDLGLEQSKKWPKGTLCITIAANIAKTGILMFDACFPDSVVGFRSSKSVTVEYVQHWLGFLQKTLEANAPESAQKNINLAILRGLDIPVPNIEIQEKFSETVGRVITNQERYADFSNRHETLFSALSQQAFTGKL